MPVPKSADRSKLDIPSEGPHVGQLRLLYQVSGVFRPQVLCALMGASGAGKTTVSWCCWEGGWPMELGVHLSVQLHPMR